MKFLQQLEQNATLILRVTPDLRITGAVRSCWAEDVTNACEWVHCVDALHCSSLGKKKRHNKLLVLLFVCSWWI